MAHRQRKFRLVVSMIVATLVASCAYVAGKTVARKDAPNVLVATDGSICIVSKERFEKTEVGMKALCGWRGATTQPEPKFGPRSRLSPR